MIGRMRDAGKKETFSIFLVFFFLQLSPFKPLNVENSNFGRLQISINARLKLGVLRWQGSS